LGADLDYVGCAIGVALPDHHRNSGPVAPFRATVYARGMVSPAAAMMAEHLRKCNDARRARAKVRASRLAAALPAAKDMLAAHGAERVWVFGSLASPDRFGERSDVDLATSGLPANRYFDALAGLMALFGGPVDLVRREDARGSLFERIEVEGRLL
jgi:predicted nucleotidyltransferase